MSELTREQLVQCFDLFAEGFTFIFSPISKDKAKLRELFLDSFDRDMAYVCLCDGRAAGMIAWGDNKRQPINMRKETCLALLGRVKGSLVYRFANPMLSKPKVKGDDEGWLDYLTTDPAYRGRGIGSKLILHARDTLPFDKLSFEVLEKNETARRLYLRLGFQEVKVKNDLVAMVVGSGRPIVMDIPMNRAEKILQ